MSQTQKLVTKLEDVLNLPCVLLSASRTLPTTAGVYFVVSSQNAQHKFLYIGRSVDLRRRLMSHNKLPQFKSFFPKVYYLEVAAYQLYPIEKAALKTFRPLFNRNGKDEPGIIFWGAELEAKVSSLQEENAQLKKLLAQLAELSKQMQQIVSAK